jgi:pyruvate ferredoxin oxidoreductase alpha subunit
MPGRLAQPSTTSRPRIDGWPMLRQIEGSAAVARSVAMCRPEVIAAYPISPQTHIVEGLSDLIRTGELSRCEYVMAESEFGAMSVCIGSSAAGARTYTATASQGLLFMVEALYNASGLGLPIVMTVANRAIGAPINIWNDHSDSMSQRDSGWIQLFAATNQEAVDLHIQAFRLAETLSVPVMVCMDGFILTHAVEEVELPAHELVDSFLPPFHPRQMLDPGEPMTIGAMVGPEAFSEVKYLMHVQQIQALDEIPAIAADFQHRFGRPSGGLVRPYRADDAETIVVSLGSVIGTIEEVVDAMREDGIRIGCLDVKCFRPWPSAEVREALAAARRVIVLEKAFAVGAGGILGQDTRLALTGLPMPVTNVVAGLGGRPITRKSLRALFDDVLADRLNAQDLHFLDLNTRLVERELARTRAGHTGPHAESMLRALGSVGSGSH